MTKQPHGLEAPSVDELVLAVIGVSGKAGDLCKHFYPNPPPGQGDAAQRLIDKMLQKAKRLERITFNRQTRRWEKL